MTEGMKLNVYTPIRDTLFVKNTMFAQLIIALYFCVLESTDDKQYNIKVL